MNKNNSTPPVEILLVEDNPNDVELSLVAFREARLDDRVYVARDGVEAIDYVFGAGAEAGHDPASDLRLILLDLKLPRIDGFEVLRRLKENTETRKIPVVILTSSSHERDVIQGYRLGVNSYIVKPVDFEEFSHVAGEVGYYWLLVNHLPPGQVWAS